MPQILVQLSDDIAARVRARSLASGLSDAEVVLQVLSRAFATTAEGANPSLGEEPSTYTADTPPNTRTKLEEVLDSLGPCQGKREMPSRFFIEDDEMQARNFEAMYREARTRGSTAHR